MTLQQGRNERPLQHIWITFLHLSDYIIRYGRRFNVVECVHLNITTIQTLYWPFTSRRLQQRASNVKSVSISWRHDAHNGHPSHLEGFPRPRYTSCLPSSASSWRHKHCNILTIPLDMYKFGVQNIIWWLRQNMTHILNSQKYCITPCRYSPKYRLQHIYSSQKMFRSIEPKKCVSCC